MRAAGSSFAASTLMVVSLMLPDRAEAQAIGFQPNPAALPDGVNLGVVPVVSADRRYVRLSLDANFSTINGFMNYPTAGAVAGGGAGGGLRGGGGGLGGALGGGGGGAGAAGAGGAGGGFRNVIGGPGLEDSGIPYSPEYLEASRKAAAQKAEKAKTLKGKKALADPVMVPMKKSEKGKPIPFAGRRG